MKPPTDDRNRLRKKSLSTISFGIWTLAAALGAQSPQPKTYGTTAVSYAEVPAAAFESSVPMNYPIELIPGGFARYTAGCSGCLMAPLRLPSGARIVSLELDAVDTDAFDFVTGTLWVCDRWGFNCSKHPAAADGPADCAFAGSVCSGKGFADGITNETADLTPDAIVVDNTQSSYFLTSAADSDTVGLGGMIVGYVLQVSPAPPSPTFNDVPASDPAYQYVEALVASGVTAGCGGGNYCPDATLTRRQMAVFLAKALGLQWP